jgi:hypothetical protein
MAALDSGEEDDESAAAAWRPATSMEDASQV